MKIATGNRINELWEELKEVLVPKSKVLKTMEEVEASTNEENVMGATAGKELINKLANGQIEFDIIDGEGFWKAAGADTWNPFKKYDVMTSNKGAASSYNASISITIPAGVKRGLLLCVSTGWQNGITQSTPAGNGLKTIVSTKYSQYMRGICSNVISIYECEFNEGGTITLSYGDANYYTYATGQFILIA